ncbi:hypothetical protein F183_A36170 [Bryobacterales bacterium F-183]|nr:hypothetical protein F183_A36170 [Bryobacterales bacterium F-183]
MPTLNNELMAGFYKEAREYLPLASECLALLSSKETREPAIAELHRITHNLKGVTAAVGLAEAAEIAQGAEELAEAIATGAVPLDDEALELFHDALRQLRSHLTADSKAAPASPVTPKPILAVPPDLVDGFLDEGRELLDRAWKQMRVASNNPSARPAALLEVRRAVHTLKGSAAMVGLMDLSKVAHAMEDLLDTVHEHKRPFTPEVGELFSKTLDTIADGIVNGGSIPSAVADALYAEYRSAEKGSKDDHRPQQDEQPETLTTEPSEQPTLPAVRIGLDRLDKALELVGEFSVVRAGWDTQLAAQRRQLDELALTIRRCQRIAHRLETEYATYSPGSSTWHSLDSGRAGFDALEFDRYTDFHLLSRDLSETASDLVTLEAQISTLASDFETTRGRYAKFSAELQEHVLQMRMAPVSTIASRLDRTVRTAARALGKEAEFDLQGSNTPLDKATLDTLSAPLEHILRNAVSHGVENPTDRVTAGKPEKGRIVLQVARDGSTAVFQVRDDGEGIHEERVRDTAVRKGLLTHAQAQMLKGSALYDLLFEPGFSTASQVSEIAGRGVGLDIVRATVESLKGTISIESHPGRGTTFTLRVPLSQAILRALFVETAGQAFALPLASVLRAGPDAADDLTQVELDEALQLPKQHASRPNRPWVILDCGAEHIALAVDRILDIREILVKPPSGILKRANAISGTTTLSDGSVVLVLRPPQLLREHRRRRAESFGSPQAPPIRQVAGPLEILVIDDSVSVRRVVANTLRKYGWNVTAARDGLDGLETLHGMERHPDVILVDVEMPRMDGYDFTAAIRSEAATQAIPVIMLTSRGGDKHRDKAFDVGVTDFLVKPYAEESLVATIRRHTRPAV